MFKTENLTIKLEQREKRGFYPSDFGKMDVELFWGFTNEQKTNIASWNETLKWGAGKGVEMQMVQVLKDSGVVPQDYVQEEHGRINQTMRGIPVRGYIDVKTIQGLPIEIKSINNKNVWDIRNYENGEPKDNYVGQLAIYMEALGVSKGYLFVATIDGLNYFLFECNKIGEGKYKCGTIEVDVHAELDKWRNIFYNNFLKGIQPDVNQYLYKFPIDEIDWKSLSKDKITKARNNKAVIGDWRVQYSDYKDKIIKLQGETLGYTDEELAKIKELTKGYSAK
ncbi:MAG: hypothetical protein GWP19_01825 [Planctomycetia bacterium]|nr:hypothetical protein [Planctomycetia bacterium]